MRGTMDRDLIAAAAPRWLAIESIPAVAQLDLIASWLESILNAVAQDHDEPDAWETLQLSRAAGTLLEGNHFAAIAFGELSLIDPARHRAVRIDAAGAGSVTLADLREAMKLIRARQ
jgi:hypothetical protein